MPITPAQLYTRFTAIHAAQMRDLPLSHPGLAVAIVGFQDWAGRALGVLVTPWCMNLVQLPGAEDDWNSLPAGAAELLALPSGRYEFTLTHDEALGAYRFCSLFSPMFDFEDQAGAIATAEAVMTTLFAAPELTPPRTLSRRGFLSGGNL